MKKLLFALAAMPFVTGIASGAERLSDAQMVQITAGALPDIICPSCLSASSMSTSTNGVTQTMSTSGSTGTGSTGSGSTGSGSTGTGSTGTGSTGTARPAAARPAAIRMAAPPNQHRRSSCLRSSSRAFPPPRVLPPCSTDSAQSSR